MTLTRCGHTGLIKGSLKLFSPKVSAGVWTQLSFGQVLSLLPWFRSRLHLLHSDFHIHTLIDYSELPKTRKTTMAFKN